ncbi:MAG: hypothetical protein IPM66_21125 [Acidobacteriota bacterium]|nr:MAG: hypothetical protein IPM66_21125 [Acidobacteriota bacterium]
MAKIESQRPRRRQRLNRKEREGGKDYLKDMNDRTDNQCLIDAMKSNSYIYANNKLCRLRVLCDSISLPPLRSLRFNLFAAFAFFAIQSLCRLRVLCDSISLPPSRSLRFNLFAVFAAFAIQSLPSSRSLR